MRALTKVTTVVAATAMVLTGMVATVGVANAAPAVSLSSDSVIPVLGTVSLTGTVLKVDGNYITIVLDTSKRKVVVEYPDVHEVIGQLKPGVKVKAVISALESLLDLVKALKVSVLS